MTERKIALFGGTFDPIHLGHTEIAAAAAEHICAEKVVFIPAKRSVLKPDPPVASSKDRLAMITLAIEDNKKFEVSNYELKKPGSSYSLETVRKFRADYGVDASIYFLVGADSIDELPYWYGITELIEECNLSVMYRAGYERPDFAKFEDLLGFYCVEKLKQNIIETPLIDISSSRIRGILAADGEAADMLSPAVADYIRQHNLYRSKTN